MKTALIKISVLHLLFAFTLYLILLKVGSHIGLEIGLLSYTWGAALTWSQMLFLIVIGYRIIYKKGVALTLILSVFKYGILLGIFVLAGTGVLRITPSFAIGCVSIVPSLTSLIFLRPYVLKGLG